MKKLISLLISIWLNISISTGQFPDKFLNENPEDLLESETVFNQLTNEPNFYKPESRINPLPGPGMHTDTLVKEEYPVNDLMNVIKKSERVRINHQFKDYLTKKHHLNSLKSNDLKELRLDSVITYDYIYGNYNNFIEKLIFYYNIYNQDTSMNFYEWSDDDNRWEISREDYQYNIDGNIIEITDYLLNDAEVLAKFWKSDISWDSAGNVTQSIDYFWDGTNNIWTPEWKEEYSIDSTNLVTQQISHSWDEGQSIWIFEYKEIYSYDNKGNLAQNDVYDWDDVNKNWINSYREITTYNSKGKEIQFLRYWEESENNWAPYVKEEYTYDYKGNLFQFVYSTWGGDPDYWVDDHKFEYQYDLEDNLISSIMYESKYGNYPLVVYHDKYQAEYDTVGRQIMRSYYSWNPETRLWNGDYKYEYTYDSLGNLTLMTNDIWDDITNDWMCSIKRETNFDSAVVFDNYQYYKWNIFLNEWEPTSKLYGYIINDGGKTLSYNIDIWDTITDSWIKSEKIEYDYNLEDIVTLQVGFKWDGNLAQWINNYKYVYDYNASGDQTYYAYFKWDTNLNDWVGNFKYEYEYDVSGNRTCYARFSWNFNLNNWEGVSKYESVYDIFGNNTSNISYKWSSESNNWIGNYKLETVYNDTGIEITTRYNWNADSIDWEPISRNYAYYSDNSPDSIIYYQWDINLNNWTLYIKYEWFYNIDENGSYYYLYSYWDKYSIKWIQGNKYLFKYNQDSTFQSEISYSWMSDEGGMWAPSHIEESLYNEDGQCIMDTRSSWDGVSYTFSTLIPGQRLEYEYDKTISKKDLILPQWFLYEDTEAGCILLQEKKYVWDPDNELWEQNNLSTYYYSDIDINSNIEEKESLAFSIYPNPTSDYVNVRISSILPPITFELFNINGQKVISKVIFSDSSISLNNLCSGFYFYRISSSEINQSGKLIIE